METGEGFAAAGEAWNKGFAAAESGGVEQGFAGRKRRAAFVYIVNQSVKRQTRYFPSADKKCVLGKRKKIKKAAEEKNGRRGETGLETKNGIILDGIRYEERSCFWTEYRTEKNGFEGKFRCGKMGTKKKKWPISRKNGVFWDTTTDRKRVLPTRFELPCGGDFLSFGDGFIGVRRK